MRDSRPLIGLIALILGGITLFVSAMTFVAIGGALVLPPDSDPLLRLAARLHVEERFWLATVTGILGFLCFLAFRRAQRRRDL